MKKHWLNMMVVLSVVGLIACAGNGNDKDTSEEKNTDVDIVDEEENSEAVSKNTSTELPDGFPSDFPLPSPITITEVTDDSDDAGYSFQIRFTFDPDIDLDATFQMYDDYASGLEYNVIIGGEEYFADGIFQYGATSKFSSADMFVVTLKPEDGQFGDIQLKVSK